MKLNNKSLVIVLLLALSLGSCKKDFLVQSPYSNLPFDQAIVDEQSMQAALYGAYAGLRGVDLFGRSVPLIGDLYADNVYVSGLNSGRYIPQLNYQVTAQDGAEGNLFVNMYNIVLRVNQIINSGITGGNTDQYISEALAIRALANFTLVQRIGRPYTDNPAALGVPVVLNYDLTSLPARNSVQEVYTQILADLDASLAKAGAFTNSSQFSPTAVKALKAKVLFTQGNYAAAKTLAEEVINTGGFSLVSPASYVTYWHNPNFRTDKMETLFEVSADPNNQNGTNSLAYIFDQDGYGDMVCTQELYDLYSATDVRKNAVYLATTGSRAGELIVDKYQNVGVGFANDDNTKILRLSEIYLIAAESEARDGGNDVAAQGYLNALLAQRDPSFAGYSSTGAQLIEDIITERRKELAFEGNRLDDLNRLKRDIVRSNQYPANAQTLAYSDYRRIYPIPQSEIDVNPNMEQNPDY